MFESELFTWLGGITTLFVIVVVMNNYKGVANTMTALGNLFGSAVGQSPGHGFRRLPFPEWG